VKFWTPEANLGVERSATATICETFGLKGARGGKICGKLAAKNMTKAERTARAKKAAAASAKVRPKRSSSKTKGED
jgi:hypothetical protein